MWRVYYADGSTWQGLEGLEPYGVICILQKVDIPERCSWIISSGAPYYVFDGHEWIRMWLNDLEDRLAHGLPIEKFLIGRALGKKDFTKILTRAQADKDAENL